MENKNYTSSEYETAKEIVYKKIGFYVHLIVYILVNLFLHILDFVNGGPYWAFWPLMGWGLGLFFHGLKTFDWFGNSEWEERQIRKEIERMRKGGSPPTPRRGA